MPPVAAPTSRLAVAALIAAAFGFTCLPGLGGVLAIALGLGAKGEIERSAGQLGGQRLARAGMLLGALSLALVAGSWLWLARGDGPQWALRAPPTPAAPVLPVPPALPSSAPAAGEGSPHAGAPKMSRDDGVVVTAVGSIELVDVGPEIHSLTQTLDEQRKLAGARQQRLLFWLVLPACQPCNGVAAALPDARMQRALAGVRLIRLDLTEFGRELNHLGVPIARGDGTVLVPAFVLLDERNRPTDYVHGGEWDADIAPNIAPVLGDFMRGQYKRRRHPWHVGHADDGVPL